MYSIDYFKKQQTQMKIGQVICIHGQYPCSLWYVANIEDAYNSNYDDDGDYDASDDEVESILATLYEVEYNGTEYYPTLNPPKIVQVYISNIQYNIISEPPIVCQFPSNYIQLYHSRRVVERASRFGDMIQLKYYDAFMPFMIINYNPVDKAHFVMSLHTSRSFKTYHLILELSEFSTLSTKELRYSIVTSFVNKGYSLELQKIDAAIEFKTRANYLFNMDKNLNHKEAVIKDEGNPYQPVNKWDKVTQSMMPWDTWNSLPKAARDDLYNVLGLLNWIPILNSGSTSASFVLKCFEKDWEGAALGFIFILISFFGIFLISFY
jgi:hypothetical protein